ncbi:MAG: hypothetical protein LBC75_13135 [Fibromonadaceae bacterium]|nr:hypothetical protein [Fibromonadaceae bacterium]
MRKIITKAIALLIAFNIAIFAQEMGTFKDTRDGKTYKTTKIGSQIWMAENLNYNASGSKCYDNKPANCTTYGRLYNLETAKKACPAGWHLPSGFEWRNLIEIAGGSDSAGGKLKTKNGWPSGKYVATGKQLEKMNIIRMRNPNAFPSDTLEFNANGTDEFGFAALPGGSGKANGSFGGVSNVVGYWGTDSTVSIKIGEYGRWWFIPEEKYSDDNTPYYYISGTYLHQEGYKSSKQDFNSVRCVQGDAEKSKSEAKAEIDAREKAAWEAKKKEQAEAMAKAEAEKKKKIEDYVKANPDVIAPFKDPRDGKTYKKFVWDNKTWMAENLNYEAKGSKCYDNKPENCKKYGRLYDYETAKKACPAGWHLPTRKEWFSESIDIKAGSGWDDETKGYKSGGGTNEIGFTALPGGFYGSDYYSKKGVNFYDVGKTGKWWIDTTGGRGACALRASYISKTGGWVCDDKTDLYSVRCVSDTPAGIFNVPVTKEVPQLSSKPAEQPKQADPPKQAEQPKQADPPKKADPPKQQSSNEFCNITFPKKACIEMPKGTCKMSGGKVVDKCK